MAKITDIKDVKNAFINLIETSPKMRLRSLEILARRQTDSEYIDEMTHVYNNKGFNHADAKVLTSIAKYAKKHGGVTPKQDKLLSHRLKKYASQLVRVAVENGSVKKVGDEYAWGAQLKALSRKNITKQEIAQATSDWKV